MQPISSTSAMPGALAMQAEPAPAIAAGGDATATADFSGTAIAAASTSASPSASAGAGATAAAAGPSAALLAARAQPGCGERRRQGFPIDRLPDELIHRIVRNFAPGSGDVARLRTTRRGMAALLATRARADGICRAAEEYVSNDQANAHFANLFARADALDNTGGLESIRLPGKGRTLRLRLLTRLAKRFADKIDDEGVVDRAAAQHCLAAAWREHADLDARLLLLEAMDAMFGAPRNDHDDFNVPDLVHPLTTAAGKFTVETERFIARQREEHAQVGMQPAAGNEVARTTPALVASRLLGMQARLLHFHSPVQQRAADWDRLHADPRAGAGGERSLLLQGLARALQYLPQEQRAGRYRLLFTALERLPVGQRAGLLETMIDAADVVGDTPMLLLNALQPLAQPLAQADAHLALRIALRRLPGLQESQCEDIVEAELIKSRGFAAKQRVAALRDLAQSVIWVPDETGRAEIFDRICDEIDGLDEAARPPALQAAIDHLYGLMTSERAIWETRLTRLVDGVAGLPQPSRLKLIGKLVEETVVQYVLQDAAELDAEALVPFDRLPQGSRVEDNLRRLCALMAQQSAQQQRDCLEVAFAAFDQTMPEAQRGNATEMLLVNALQAHAATLPQAQRASLLLPAWNAVNLICDDMPLRVEQLGRIVAAAGALPQPLQMRVLDQLCPGVRDEIDAEGPRQEKSAQLQTLVSLIAYFSPPQRLDLLQFLLSEIQPVAGPLGDPDAAGLVRSVVDAARDLPDPLDAQLLQPLCEALSEGIDEAWLPGQEPEQLTALASVIERFPAQYRLPLLERLIPRTWSMPVLMQPAAGAILDGLANGLPDNLRQALREHVNLRWVQWQL